jgi:7-cyano-7-deazaguanine synthase
MVERPGRASPPLSLRRRAVVLLSGGLDSTTTLAIARAEGFDCYAITVDYGQRHRLELDAAGRVASALGACGHVVLEVDLARFGGSALTAEVELPRDRDPGAMTDIPITYVPARNTVFLSLALAWAETLGAEDLFIGVNVLDYSGYPDCRPEYLEAFERMANLATRAGVEGTSRFRIHAPLIGLTKAEIVRRACALDVDLGLTWSCYDPRPGRRPCGACDACVLRRKGFEEAGVADPLAATSD